MKFFRYFIIYIIFMILDDVFNFPLMIYLIGITFTACLFTISSLKYYKQKTYEKKDIKRS